MSTRCLTNARGNALLATLAILFGLTIVASTYILLAATETQIAGNDSRSTRAMYVAEAGLQEALSRLGTPGAANSIAETGTPTPAWGRYIVLVGGNSALDPARGAQAADGLDNNANGTADEAGEHWPEVLSVQAGSPLAYPWVRVQYKKNGAGQVLLFGDADRDPTTPDVENTTVGAPEYVVTASGVVGPSTRVIQATAQHVPFPPVPAALYTNTTNVTFDGTQFEVCGYDYDPATGDSIPGNPTIPGIATTGDPALITTGLGPQQDNNIIGSGGTPSVVHSDYTLDMQAYFNFYAQYADIVYTTTVSNPNTSGWGDMNTYHITEIEGDLHLSGTNQGGGVLLVQGNMDVSGQFTWYGAIICLGSVNFTGGGGGVHVYGGMMVANGATMSETYSGNADIYFSSSALNKLNFLGPFRLSGWREL